MVVIEKVVPNLRVRHLGLSHLAIAGATVLSILSTVLFAGWVLVGQTTSLVQSDQSDVIPAFVSSLAQSPAKPKTLVLSSTPSQTVFFISRGNPLTIGDADVATATPPQIVDAVTQLVSGSGVSSAKVMGSYGIQYLYLKSPASPEIARLIDGVGGFTRMSATDIGIVWHIVGSSPRVVLTDSKGRNTLIPAGDVGALGVVKSAGVISLAEKYDRSWRLLINGASVPLQHADNGLPIFTIPTSGKVSLLFDGTAHRGLISLELMTLLVAIVMALPSGRRKRQVPLEELV